MSSKILIVEEDDSNSSMLSEYLEKHNISTTIIHKDDDVVNACYQQLPDIIIMDIDTYGIEGMDACVKLKSDESFRRTPIFAITALTHDKFNEEYHEDIFDEYIDKPVMPSDLLKTIKKYL